MPATVPVLPQGPRVAAVVVNYDGKEITREAVLSLRRMSYPAWDLVVLDNGSRDGSVEALAAEFPDLLQLRLRENRGSAAGYAAGLRWAFARGYDFVLLLNNDIEVEPDMLAELVRVTASRQRGYGEIDHGQLDAPGPVDYVNGCAILIRRTAAEAVGAWDPLYFICVDDADFCTRLARGGWRCLYAPRAVLHHRVAWTTGGFTPGRNFQLGRSSALYVRRYGNLLQQARFLAWVAVAFVAGFLRELPRGNQTAAVAKVKGVLAGLRAPLPPPPALEPPPAELEELRPAAGAAAAAPT